MSEVKRCDDRLQLHNECNVCDKSFDIKNVIPYLATLALFLIEIPFLFHNIKAHKLQAKLVFKG